MTSVFSPLRWESGVLFLIDQLRLPREELWIPCRDEVEVADAIRRMVVRGAPAIGCAAAFGVALAARRLVAQGAGSPAFEQGVRKAIDQLASTRPTAVNLFWALNEMRSACQGPPENAARALEERAMAIWKDDVDRCLKIGQAGAELIPDGATILTHCNAGALATGGYGTALGVIRAARDAGKRIRVLADETRPFLQGARLTAWELARDKIDVTLIPDVAAAWLMRNGQVSCVVVGADRIAANGDVANKIGTYPLALAAREHQVPFFVAAPFSTVDPSTPDGDAIPIEERQGGEVTQIAEIQIAPQGVAARNPAFDVTPARLVSAIVTEQGVYRPPYDFR
ncbi:MAG: S-methyl-5-thioribose-1-phosphate isomerase [Deltaproteobacteria bacterium]|nr:S-methyl-5-thioribose-1-phosphate isomerase [Deltaproteobacteria bacterium]